jgi:glycosyltransferase involved in cell wall biosynthesis
MTIPGQEQPLVSVVTPVYNGAEFIRECIESVLAQTHQNWEYVIVDNCSTDGTLQIAREYEARDDRIRIITPGVFVDQIESANRSLSEISPESKYTKVLHADDWMFPECVERMVELVERTPSVGVVSSYRLEETRVTLTGLSYSISALPGHEICRAHLHGQPPYPYLFGSPSSLLIRSDLIRARDPFYDPGDLLVDGHAFTEDRAACFAILREADFGFVHQVLTFTRRDERSPFSAYVRIAAGTPEHINLLVRYGPEYLTKAEYRRALAVALVQYGFVLIRRVTRLSDREFRVYHRAALASLRRRIDAQDVLEGMRLQVQRMRATGKLRPGASAASSR